MPPKSKSNKKKKKCVESKPPALECTLADPPPSISRVLQDLTLNPGKTVCAHPGCTAPAHKKCSVCEGVRYCSKAHQTLDWPGHKLVCEPVDKQIYHGQRFDPSGLWADGDVGDKNSRLKTEYLMGNAGMMQELQILAWRHRGVRPVILIETLASGEDAHDPRVTLVPESEWRKKEEYQPPGSIDMPYPIAELVRQVDINKNFFLIYELRHIPHAGRHGRYVRGVTSANYCFGCHPADTKMEEALAHDAKRRREFELEEGPVDHDWTKPGGRESEGGFISALPTDEYDVYVMALDELLMELPPLPGPLGDQYPWMKLLFCSSFKEWLERIPIGTKVRLRGMTGEGARFNGKVGVIQRSLNFFEHGCRVVLRKLKVVVLAEVRACELMRPSNAIARRTSPTGTN
jgi:hypothetical protein